MREFYSIEVEYYVIKVIDNLQRLSARRYTLVGEGKYKISVKRVSNVVKMMDMLIQYADIKLNQERQSVLANWR